MKLKIDSPFTYMLICTMTLFSNVSSFSADTDFSPLTFAHQPITPVLENNFSPAISPMDTKIPDKSNGKESVQQELVLREYAPIEITPQNFTSQEPVLREYALMENSVQKFTSNEPAFPQSGQFDLIPIKTASTIYLDSSKVNKPLLKFDMPMPSEYSQQQKSTETPYSPIKEKNNSQNLSRTEDSENAETKFEKFNDVFAPPSEFVSTPTKLNPSVLSPENLSPESLPPEKLPPKDLPSYETTVRDNSSYYASVEEMPSQENIDFEGRMISGITINGLSSLDENIVYQQIKIKRGSRFNSELLQSDLQRIYNTGYFTDNMCVDPKLNADGTVNLTFVLSENVKVNDVVLEGNTVLSDAELYNFVKPLKGIPQNLNLINDAIDKINEYYHNKGYILANVTSVDDTKNGTLKIGITEGRIEKIVFEGNEKTKDYVIERNIITTPGSVYNEEFIKKDLANVYATQIFEDVDRKIEPSPDKEGEYIVTIKVKEGSSNSVSIGGGIDNALGVFGSIGFNENNFLGRAQKLSLTGMVGSGVLLSDASIKNRMNFNFELNFVEPHFLNADNSLLSKIYYRDLGSYQIPLAIERRFGVNAAVEHKVKGFNNLKTNLGIGFEQISLREGDKAKTTELFNLNHIDISERAKQLQGGAFLNITPGVKYSTVDDETMPREGLIAKASYIESIGLSRIKSTNGRVAGSVTKYIPVFKKSTLSIGAKGGFKVHGKEMPEVMAFRLGGPYSIRGFKMNGVGTGEAFLMGSAELQTPIPYMDRFKYEVLKNMRFAFFVDAGKVFEPTISSKLYDRPLSAVTAGVGLRIYIPGVGPISLDYGLPFTNVGKYGNSGGYFTFGTGGLYDSY